MTENKNDMLNEFLNLKEYIDNTHANLVDMQKDDISKEERNLLAYECKANIQDLIDELKTIEKEITKAFKISTKLYKQYRDSEDNESNASVEVLPSQV
jgi:hypothetical protein